MKTLKSILFGTTAVLAVAIVMTSCEQEAVLPIEINPDTSATTLVINDNNQEESKYIVLFQDNTEKRTDLAKQLKGKSRTEVSVITEAADKEFKNEAANITQKLGITDDKIENYYSFINGVSMMLTAKEAAQLKTSPLVKSIDLDQKVDMELPVVKETQNPLMLKAGTDYYGNFNRHHGGYRTGGQNKNTWIWIVDTGIDLDHPDLNVITNTYYAKSFVGGTPDDCDGHGTHVAGIAAAKSNNYGIVGMSAGAWVVPLKVLHCTNGSSYDYITQALQHVYNRGKYGDVVNISMGGKSPVIPALQAAMNNLNDRGIYIVVAAGNAVGNLGPFHASEFQPANNNNTRIVTIANMHDNGVMAADSNYGMSVVDYIATGQNVYSTDINGGFAYKSGTSMAAPVVAGIIHARGSLPGIKGYAYNRGERYPKPTLW